MFYDCSMSARSPGDCGEVVLDMSRDRRWNDVHCLPTSLLTYSRVIPVETRLSHTCFLRSFILTLRKLDLNKCYK